MSRTEYSYDLDNWSHIRWRGAVSSAIKGRRGQKFLKELLKELDAMTEKTLISSELESDGQLCTLGVLGNAKNIDISKIDPTDSVRISNEFDIAEALAMEVAFMNDEGGYAAEKPEYRWLRMRWWAGAQIVAV